MATNWNGTGQSQSGVITSDINQAANSKISLYNAINQASGVEIMTPHQLSATTAAQANTQVDQPLSVPESEDSGIGNNFASNLSRSRQRISGGKYKQMYNKYYSASDFIIKIKTQNSEAIWLDKASGVAVSESLSSNPIYTLGDSRVNFFSRGNLIVTGFISVNTISADYISRVLANINGQIKNFKPLTPREQMALSAEKLKAYLKEKEKYEQQEVEALSTLGFADYSLFTVELEYNNSDAVEKVTSFSREILDCRIIGFEHGVDIGGDGQLVDGYKFIAREIV